MIYTIIIHDEDHTRHSRTLRPVVMRAHDWFYAPGWGKICPKEAQ